MSDSTVWIVCSSKCLYCGRQTPHEVCHQHSEAVHPGWWDDIQENVGSDVDPMDLIWRTGRDKEPETCTDPDCPVWEPGEWDRIQAEAAMTPDQRGDRFERIQQGIAERRAARGLEG
jgi:hypothetical protein